MNSNKEPLENQFISRIDGNIYNKSNFPPTINEETINNAQIESFKFAAEAFRLNDVIQDTNPLKYLCMEWNFPKEHIKNIFTRLGNSFDTTNEFLNIWDGSDTLMEAWDTYCDKYDIMEPYPFFDIEK